MSKKLLAMAVAAAVFAPAAASADTKLYGMVQAEYNIEDSDANGVDSQQAIDDDGNRSRLGVKFSEKLGGGLTAFGKLEWSFNPSDGGSSSNASSSKAGDTGGFGSRDQHVGIKSSWGSIAAGSFHAPYKTAGGVKWDPWTATHLQARRAGGMSGGTGIGGHNGFMRNAIYYTSPKVNGFLFQFAISPDETNPGANNGGDNSDDGDNDYSLAVQYKNGPWHALFAHNRNNVSDRNASAGQAPTVDAVGFVTNAGSPVVTAQSRDDETLTKVGLRYHSGPWTFAGQYETIDDARASATGGTPGVSGNYRPTTGSDADIYWLNAQYKVGNNIFTASYGNTDIDQTGGASDVEYDYFTIGVIHKFSKKTRIFAGYTETEGDSDSSCAARGAMGACNSSDRDAFSIGIRKDF